MQQGVYHKFALLAVDGIGIFQKMQQADHFLRQGILLFGCVHPQSIAAVSLHRRFFIIRQHRQQHQRVVDLHIVKADVFQNLP